MAKTVLVSLEERNRPVTFSGAKENLLEEIRVVFKDQLASEEDVYLQIKDESWGGIFVDVLNQEIPDRSILKATRIIPAVGHREKSAQQDVPLVVVCTCQESIAVADSPNLAVATPAAATQLKLAFSPAGIQLRKPTCTSTIIDTGCSQALQIRSRPWLRSLQETEQSEPNIDATEICEQAKIFKKEPISRYHSAINDAAATICLKTPSMLTKRADLLALARKSVDESGFLYTKGKSRSKAFGSEAGEGLPLRKRPKISQEFRETRRKNITEDLSCINTQIQFKERRIETEATSRNFKMCDLLSEEVAELKKKRQLLESELTLLIKKEKKSKMYYRRKEKQHSSGDSDAPLSDTGSFPRSSRSTVSPSPPFSPPLFLPQTQIASCSQDSRVGSPTETIILSGAESSEPETGTSQHF